MNKHRIIALVGLALAFSNTASPAFAEGQAAGLPCANESFGIKTMASDNADDLLACVNGTWHSMIFHGGVPQGTIAPFYRKTCPEGWVEVTALAGRTIIGAGAGEDLTPRAVGDEGGEEKHQMTVAELVPHTVTMTFGASDKGGKGNGYAYSDNAGGATILAYSTKTSNSIGQGKPFNVMMPYYALLYCMKQ